MNETQITKSDGTKVYVGATDVCEHCLYRIARAADGYDLPNGEPSFTWYHVHTEVLECDGLFSDLIAEPIGCVFPAA